MTTRYLLCGLFCLLFSCLISPFVLALCKRLRASQSILHWVDKHAQKEGTPTMGGIIFLIVLLFSSIFFDLSKRVCGVVCDSYHFWLWFFGLSG